MRRRNFLAVFFFSLTIILVVWAIITYNFVWCNDGFLDSSHPICAHLDSSGNIVAKHNIDQERPYLSIIGEILGAVLCFAAGILFLVSAFKAPKGPGPTGHNNSNKPIGNIEPGPRPPN